MGDWPFGKSGLFSVPIREKKDGLGSDENRFAGMVRTSCLVASLLLIKAWARPCTGSVEGGRRVVVGDGEGMK